ncbi:hypothetical protein [Rariglobus hedericola]|uniref:Uncharacterized protein n=1 Tax=Rariglobus hedericola TaxID=2597822 RepID=A0A556QRV6_9BACT|nr:hypothetical protein [Rariglobus hedericola]TSJ79368.1 hypothetical protein FPL22_08780 [Rariglobus hedericola]
MSDESPPPQLRLRPRKRDDEPTLPVPPAAPVAVDATPAPVETPVIAAPAESTDAPVRFRLKPKLTSEPEAQKVDAVIEPAPSVPSVPATTPSLFTMPPVEDSAGVPRLKLKSLAPGAIEAPSGAPLPALPPVPPIPPPPPVIVSAASIQLPAEIPGSLLVGALPPVVVKPVSAPPPIPRAVSVMPPPPVVLPPAGARSKPPAKGSPKKMVVVISVLIAVPVIFGAAIYFFMYRDASPAGASASTNPAATSAQPAAIKVVGTDTQGAGPQIAPLPIQPSQMPAPVLSSNKPRGPTNAAQTAALRAWVEEARITGVVDGASPRAIINNRLVRPGEMVDATQGIIFDGLDVGRKKLIFRTASGVFAEKSY